MLKEAHLKSAGGSYPEKYWQTVILEEVLQLLMRSVIAS